MGRIVFCRKQFRIIDLRHIVTWGRLSRIYSYIFLDTICRISYRTLIGSYLGPMHLTLDVSRWHIVSGHIVLGKIVRCYIVWQIFQNINTVWDQHLKMSTKWIPDVINFFYSNQFTKNDHSDKILSWGNMFFSSKNYFSKKKCVMTTMIGVNSHESLMVPCVYLLLK